MHIDDLSSHPDLRPQLVDAFFAEWPEWCHRVGRSKVESIFEGGDPLPVILVALEAEAVLGTIALRAWFADDPMPQTPWVRQLLVLPRYRGRGVDRALIAAVERRARGLGFDRLHAATNRIQRLLARRGWRVFDHGRADGEEVAWLAKDLAPQARDEA